MWENYVVKYYWGIDLNYQGNIFIDNQNIREIKNYCRKHVGFIFQDFNLINWLNVKNNYLLPGFFTKIIYKRAIEDQEEKLELQKLKRKKSSYYLVVKNNGLLYYGR
ncbi:hypothetical protein SD457_05740 [Coprobacillaceae bacterium CR2/5/TPMF4]|nr:hypothetical protein SD457_05740 [Coprobacillaceae bacterium CR2/5/TPMF4]